MSFAPNKVATVSIVVAATTANVQMLATGTTGTTGVRVMNNGSATVWVNFGDNTVTATVPSGATAGSIPVGPGAAVDLIVTGTHAAAIAAGATGSVYFTPGVIV